MKTRPLVSVLIVLYNNSKYIAGLFETLTNQTYSNIEVIFVDNGSVDNTITELEKFSRQYSKQINTQHVKLDKNTGFAFANNHIASIASGSLLLFMNSDVLLEPAAIEELVDTYIKNHKRHNCAGVAPKMYLSSYLPEKVFDSFGICINADCSPYNRAIGQIDIGQYDKVEAVMGCCFGCALIDINIFNKLGGLDKSYFAYFEDVDWCIRARKSGYTFYSSPTAVAYHVHSASTSKNSYSWKHYLIFRNYLRTVTKSLGNQSAVRIIPKKIIDLSKTVVAKSTPSILRLSSLKVILNFILFDSWKYYLKRSSAQSAFIPEFTDGHLFTFSVNEPSHFFDPVNYKQSCKLEMYEYSIRRFISASKTKRKFDEDWNALKKSRYLLSNDVWQMNFYKLISRFHS